MVEPGNTGFDDVHGVKVHLDGLKNARQVAKGLLHPGQVNGNTGIRTTAACGTTEKEGRGYEGSTHWIRRLIGLRGQTEQGNRSRGPRGRHAFSRARRALESGPHSTV